MDILTARSTPDFLAMVPTLAGGDVARSLVLIPFCGTRTLPTLCRLDLPARERRSDLSALISGAVGILSRMPRIDRVDVVIYTDRTFESEQGIPHLELGRAALRGLARAGFHVGLAACVAGDGWGSYLEKRHLAEGHPLDDIRNSAVLGRLLAGADDEQDLRARDVPDAAQAARAAVDRMIFGDDMNDEQLVPFSRTAPLVDILDTLIAGAGDPVLIALALTAFESPATRDIALLHYAFGREVGERAVRDSRHWAEVVDRTGLSMDEIVEADMRSGGDSEFGDLLLGRTERIPERTRLVAGIRYFRTLVAHAPDELRAPPLMMLGWTLWAIGSTAAAGAMLDRVLRLDPAYRMAAMLRTWIDAGAMPDWLFSRLEPRS